MDNGQLNWIAGFIWGIADDVLRDVYVRGKYRDVILPMTVIRRLDALLEPTKDAVLKMKEQLDKAGIANQDAALCQASSQAFHNTSPFILRDLKARAKQQQLKADFEAYLDGFSPNVQEILDKFKLRNQIPTLVEADILGSLIEKFLDPSINLSPKPVFDAEGNERLPGLDNHAMGTIFEELIRRFNEENNEEAGEHFTPRDVVKLMASLVFLPIADEVESGTYLVYDGACGTGGMLTVAEETLARLAADHDKEVSIHLFGQEINPETFAITKADLLLKGEGDEAENMKYGSTLSADAFLTRQFDFMLSNPPYGKSWKTDLERMGGKKDLADPRFTVQHDGDELSLITRSSDGQLMFLVNKLAKMKHNTPLGSRIAEVHNGSSLFTGDAGQGESNIRRWIIENDWLEAVIALPNDMFYNTPMETFIWLLSNRKGDERKGKIQLIDASQLFEPLRKNLGKKTCKLSDDHIKQIVDMFLAFEETEQSKIFPNATFGYWKISVERPLRLAIHVTPENLAAFKKDAPEKLHKPAELLMGIAGGPDPRMDFNIVQERFESAVKKMHIKLHARDLKSIYRAFTFKHKAAEPVIKKKSKEGVDYEPDPDLRDTEKVPFLYADGIPAFYAREIRPRFPDAWVDPNKTVVGYRIPFNKIFFRPPRLSHIHDVIADTDRLLTAAQERSSARRDLMNIVDSLVYGSGADQDEPELASDERALGMRWMGRIPAHWRVEKAKHIFAEVVDKGHPEEELLSVTQDRGVVARSSLDINVVMPSGDTSGYKLVMPGDCVISLRSFQGGIEYSECRGIVSPAYVVLRPRIKLVPSFFKYLMKTPRLIAELATAVSGVRQGKNITYEDFCQILLPLPPLDEQGAIGAQIESLLELASIHQQLSRSIREEATVAANELVTGKVASSPETARTGEQRT